MDTGKDNGRRRDAPLERTNRVGRQFVELADAVREGRERHKRTIASVAMWGLGHGTVVRRDVLALVLLATDGKRLWRRTDVCHEMGITILNWCLTASATWTTAGRRSASCLPSGGAGREHVV